MLVLSGVLACLAVPTTIVVEGDLPGERPRNVVLVVVDSVRADSLGCYGASLPTSPTIDRLAEQGVTFDDVSAATCSLAPSMASLLSGLYPIHRGIQAPPLAQYLADRRMRTRAFLSLVTLPRDDHGLPHGFAEEDFTHVSRLKRASGLMDQGLVDERGLARVDHAELLTDAAVSFLDELRGESFFLLVQYPNYGFETPATASYRDEFVTPYDGVLDRRPDRVLPLLRHGTPLLEADLRFLEQTYAVYVRNLDDRLAPLMHALKERGLEDETLVVLTSTHGMELGDRGVCGARPCIRSCSRFP